MGAATIAYRFVWAYDGVSRVIRAFERDGDSPIHVDCVLPEGRLLGAHMRGGVLVNQPGYDAAQDLRDLVVPITVGEEQQQKWESFLLAQAGKPYDFTAIAGIAINRDWRSPDSWFCSELAAAALEAGGVIGWPLAVTDNRISPRDFLVVLSAIVPVVIPPPKGAPP